MTKTKYSENTEPKNKVSLYLAPMAGYTDLPFRLLAQEYGADITTSEMVSAKGLYYNNEKTKELLTTVPEEHDYGIQIFGSEPDVLEKTVKNLTDLRDNSELSFDFIDFNVGCPAPKIVKNGDGSALLEKPELLYDCITAIKENSSVPVSVKTRLGLTEDKLNTIYPIIEKANIDRLTIHPRTREQFYSGTSNWQSAKAILDIAEIPIVLSGDIITPEKAKEAYDMGFTNLMIGRAAVENPFIFNQIKDYLSIGSYQSLGFEDRIQMALKHIDYVEKYNNNKNAVIGMRKHLAAYTKGLPNSKEFRNKIFSTSDFDQAREIFRGVEQ